MSYNIHIPIDDISDADLENDLEAISRLRANEKPPSAPSVESGRQKVHQNNAIFSSFPALNIVENVGGGGGSKTGYSNVQHTKATSSSVGGNGNGIIRAEGSDKLISLKRDKGEELQKTKKGRKVTDLDLALARSMIKNSKSNLVNERMREASWKGSRTERGPWENDGTSRKHRVQGKTHSRHGAKTTTKDGGAAKKHIFVNSLRKDREEMKLGEDAADSDPSRPGSRSLQDLMSELKHLDDDDDDRDVNTSQVVSSAEDISDELKIEKAERKTIKPSKPKNSRPQYEKEPVKKEKKKKLEQKGQSAASTSANHIGLKKIKVKGENQEAKLLAQPPKNSTNGVEETEEDENTEGDDVYDEKEEGKDEHDAQQGYRTQSEFDNRAVAKMVAMDRHTPTNRSVFHLVDKGVDRVDLPLSESAGAWETKIHGQRDIVVAGSLVMCLGLIVIAVSLIALFRRRFINSTRSRKKANVNNNQGYRSLGSASETEILRKPRRSLFPLASSDEDDDDDDDDDEGTSGSDEEIVYHKQKTSRRF